MKIKISNTMLNCLLAALATGIIFEEKFHLPLKIFVLIFMAAVIVGIICTWRKNFKSQKILSRKLNANGFFVCNKISTENFVMYQNYYVIPSNYANKKTLVEQWH